VPRDPNAPVGSPHGYSHQATYAMIYPMRPKMTFLSTLIFSCAVIAFAQNPEYDFYSDFRGWSQQSRRTDPSLNRDQILERYAAKLRSEGISDTEIQRRNTLVRASRIQLEDDFWNRFFTQGKANYNTAPNGFLAEVVESRTPGAALDYGMGEGRNALFLAKLGWRVSGFDPAGEAVALAQKRAKGLGLTLDTKPVRDSEYDFGKDRFDLVLFSWVVPGPEFAGKIEGSLKPGGIVVMECGADWVGRNGMLRLFDALQIVRYEIVTSKSDFFDRRDMEVLRLVARKPAK
jgi:2-polyprenyl-3-methyl-5-hydroxy-6-metoxy-1,4-benzoquinol methylase